MYGSQQYTKTLPWDEIKDFFLLSAIFLFSSVISFFIFGEN